MALEMGRVGIERVEGWGMSVGSVARVIRPENLDQLRAVLAEARKAGVTLAPRGTGCSYGDASTTEQGWCLDLTHMNRVLSFDESTGDADLEGGATIRQLWRRS
ncbi:MAG: FAD-dependent oxidoreductase, partial [bacterium]